MRVKKLYPYSSILGQQMPVSIYGHFGTPILFFPTASSDFEELERHGMIAALSHHLDAGRIKIISLDSLNQQSWFNKHVSVAQRLARQAQYDAFVAHELLDIIYADCQGTLPVATAGSSLGAFHAANTLFRHPDQFKWGFFMSGIYDLSEYFDGYMDHNCYWQNPLSYLPGASPEHVRAINTCDINILCGQGPWERVHWSQALHNVLDRIGVRHNYDLWGHDVAHDWEWWFRQMDLYVEKKFG